MNARYIYDATQRAFGAGVLYGAFLVGACWGVTEWRAFPDLMAIALCVIAGVALLGMVARLIVKEGA